MNTMNNATSTRRSNPRPHSTFALALAAGVVTAGIACAGTSGTLKANVQSADENNKKTKKCQA